VLRPFQRKVALYGTAKDIIDTLDYIPVYQRMEGNRVKIVITISSLSP